MKECIYLLNKNILKTAEGEKYITYGIEAWIIKNCKSYLVQYIPDIFFEYDRAKKLVNLCNSMELSYVHLTDIIEDEFS